MRGADARRRRRPENRRLDGHLDASRSLEESLVHCIVLVTNVGDSAHCSFRCSEIGNGD
uniref:Uncharacterized protein n=1 Tax=Leersia perrieri TaxID=77586 RepID=A0A0D9W1W9_9ORYZ